jgi:hypothetical protein
VSPRRVAIAIGLVLLADLFGLAAVTFRQLNRARGELATARSTLEAIAAKPDALGTAEGRTQALKDIDQAVARVDAAQRDLRHSDGLSLARVVPGLRTQRAGLLTLTDDARRGALAGRALIAQVDRIAKTARFRQGVVPLRQIADLQGPVRATGLELGGLVRSPAGLWGPVADARRKFDATAGRIRGRLLGAADSLQVSRAFLGADAPRRYLLTFQNNAEMRDQGIVLSYAVVDVAGGHLSFEHAGSITELALTRPVGVPVPVGTQAAFGSTLPTKLWQSVNATADFAWSGQTMAAMYQQAKGRTIDGVIAIDVPGLAALLRVTGPVTVDGLAEPLTETSAPRLLLHDVYQHAPTDSAAGEREKQILARSTQVVIDRLSRGDFDAVQLGRELGDTAAGGHMKLWSRIPAEEQEFERVGLGGGPAVQDATRTFHLAVQNRTATKLDYYVHPVVTQQIRLTPSGDAVIRTTIGVRNDAPAGAPPSEQLGPDGQVTFRPGDYIASVCWWGPASSSQDDSSPESGLQLTQYFQTEAAGQSTERTILTVIHHAVRNGQLELRYVPQPRLDPVPLSVTLDAAGWHVDGSRAKRLSWNRTLRLAWSVTR